MYAVIWIILFPINKLAEFTCCFVKWSLVLIEI